MSPRRVLPLRERPWDYGFLAFFWVNLVFVSYQIDLESIVIRDPTDFEYPLWPPPFMVDLIHWWGRTFDPVLLARPVWWMVTIWLDAVVFGPFYVFAIHAYTKGRDWIRLPSVIYAAILFTNVSVILAEEIWGPHRSPRLGVVLLANAPWFLFPFLIVARMWRENPFTVEDA
jgi:hypothetical protein